MEVHGALGVIFRYIALCALVAAAFFSIGCDRRPAAPKMPIPEVAVMTVEPQRLVLTSELPGRTSAYRIAEIRPQVNGVIQKRLFVEGSFVKEGEVLYQIDPAPFQAALDNARAALARSEANLPAVRSKAERSRGLLAANAVSKQDHDDKEAALKQAEADVEYWKATAETARINLGYTRVTATISGRIGKSNVTDGALVTAYQALPLATIQQLDPMYVDVPQSTTELLRLRRRLEAGRLNQNGKNQEKVKILLEDGALYPLEGTFQFRDVTVDPTTASVVLRVVFPNPDGVLLPGMFVRAVVREGVLEQALLVPQQAVSRDPKGNPFLLLVNPEGKIEQRMIILERAMGDRWLVASGLAPGDTVVTEGLQKARPGVTVKVVPYEADPKGDSKPGSTPKSAEKPN